MSTPGRPKENAPEGYYTVKEAADLLGVHPETIRNRLRDGRLEGLKPGDEGEHTTQAREPRYYVLKEAVGLHLGRATEVARWGYQSDIPLEIEDIMRRYVEMYDEKNRELFRGNQQRAREMVEAAAERIANEVREQKEEFVGAVKESIEREKHHQERVREHEEAIRRLLVWVIVLIALFAALALAVLVYNLVILH